MASPFVPVLGSDFTRPVQTTDFYVSSILDRRKTSQAVKLLSDCLPLHLGEFRHLKRVRTTGGKDSQMQILLCPRGRGTKLEGATFGGDSTVNVPSKGAQSGPSTSQTSYSSKDSLQIKSVSRKDGEEDLQSESVKLKLVSSEKDDCESRMTNNEDDLKTSRRKSQPISVENSVQLNSESECVAPFDTKLPVDLTSPQRNKQCVRSEAVCEQKNLKSDEESETYLPNKEPTNEPSSLLPMDAVSCSDGGPKVDPVRLQCSSDISSVLSIETAETSQKDSITNHQSVNYKPKLESERFQHSSDLSPLLSNQALPDTETPQKDQILNHLKVNEIRKSKKMKNKANSKDGRGEGRQSESGPLALLRGESLSGVLSSPYVLKVPLHAPLTRRQFEESKIYWPVHFHEDKAVTQLVEGKSFSADEESEMKAHLRQAEQLAAHARQTGQGQVGAVIVDPADGSVVASGHSLTRDNPLLHAAMVAVDLVARSQGGGMWNLEGKCLYSRPAKPTKAEPQTGNRTSEGRPKTGPYLCTGYHVYLSEEPCPMCAMALLHSRVSCVVYRRRQPGGALGSHCKLHTIPSLNHHFQVFQFTGDLGEGSNPPS